MESMHWGTSLQETAKWHKRNVKVSLNGSIDPSLIVADLPIREWSHIISKRPKYGYDHVKHVVKGVTFHSTSNTAFLIKGRHCKCANCGIKSTRLVVVRPSMSELATNRNAKGRLAYIVNIKGRWYPLTVDHIVAQCKGGANKIRNLQILCLPCNQLKGCYPEVIPFNSYIVPSKTIQGRLKIWKNSVIRWAKSSRVPLTTIDR